MATRKVIGWSLPSTLPTAAKPSSESARDTRSTLGVSTCSVSTRAPGPNSRAIDAVTCAGGAPEVCALSSNSASARLTSKLVADAEAQHLGLARPGRVAQQPIVPLERGVPSGLVGDAHGSHRERPAVVARVRGDERHRSSEGPGADCRVRIGRPPVPERASDLDARARPLEPARDRWVREARLAALLASRPDPLAGR